MYKSVTNISKVSSIHLSFAWPPSPLPDKVGHLVGFYSVFALVASTPRKYHFLRLIQLNDCVSSQCKGGMVCSLDRICFACSWYSSHEDSSSQLGTGQDGWVDRLGALPMMATVIFLRLFSSSVVLRLRKPRPYLKKKKNRNALFNEFSSLSPKQNHSLFALVWLHL